MTTIGRNDGLPVASRGVARLDALQSQPDHGRVQRGADVRAVATEFEAVMLQELVRSMRATATPDGKEPDNDQLVEHLMDEAMAGHLARAGGIGLADYLVGPVTSQEALVADETLKFQGRIDVSTLEQRLRFPATIPDSQAPTDRIPPAVDEAP